jgi:hypothetical protein
MTREAAQPGVDHRNAKPQHSGRLLPLRLRIAGSGRRGARVPPPLRVVRRTTGVPVDRSPSGPRPHRSADLARSGSWGSVLPGRVEGGSAEPVTRSGDARRELVRTCTGTSPHCSTGSELPRPCRPDLSTARRLSRALGWTTSLARSNVDADSSVGRHATRSRVRSGDEGTPRERALDSWSPTQGPAFVHGACPSRRRVVCGWGRSRRDAGDPPVLESYSGGISLKASCIGIPSLARTYLAIA